jgi:hypothetical protein
MVKMNQNDIIIVGGGAVLQRLLWKKSKTESLERGADVLQKLEFPAVEDATSRTLFLSRTN